MTFDDDINREAIQTVINVLRRFNQFDHKMQVSAILTLLEVSMAGAKGDPLSVQDIEKKIGLHSGTASRNVYYWADGTKGVSGAYEMVNIGFNPQDRRLRVLSLTAKGKAFIRDIFRHFSNPY